MTLPFLTYQVHKPFYLCLT